MGENTLDDLRDSLTETGLEQEDILLAYFAVFFHHDLFFDAGKTDSPRFRQLLEYELLHERIRLPYRYGRLLCIYRFNDTNSDTRTDHLMSPDVDRLLQGGPMGVYQVGTLLSGPLGVLDSQEKRWIPAMLSYPLWHCSDTGCNAIHNVRFVPPSIPVVDAFSRIQKSLPDRHGPPSEWWQSLSWIHRGVVSHPSRRPYLDLPLLIADYIIALQRPLLWRLPCWVHAGISCATSGLTPPSKA